MTDISTSLNRAFREHRRYTGDGLPGEPVGAPLPIGDPQSGVHNPSKAEIRGAFSTVGEQISAAVGDSEAARDAALAAQVAAESAAGANLSNADSRAAVEVTNIPAPVNYIRTAGYAAPGDGGEALYKRVETEPAHAGKVQSADGAWWELADIVINVRQFGAKGDLVTNDRAAIQACIDAAALTSAEYAGATQEEYKRARRKVVVPDGGYLVNSTVYVYEGSWVEFTPLAHFKLGADAMFGISTVNRPGQTNPNSGIERVVLMDVRLDMDFKGRAGLLLQSLRESDIIRPYIWNVPASTFNYDDDSGLGSVTYPRAGIILKGRAIANGGCYYNRIVKPAVRNETTDGVIGRRGIWIGTTPTGDAQYANFNRIVEPYCINMAVGIDLDNGNDNTILYPEVSNSALGTGVGIRVGNAANTEAAKRNYIHQPYMENLATGLDLTSKASATFIIGKGSISNTTTELSDSGSNTAFFDNEIGSGSARFYRREIRGVTQVQFAAAQQASTNANTLDDYEEGTFTPTIEGTTTAGTGTYSSQTGRYTKVGNRVFVHALLNWTAHTGTGDIRIAGLPFTSISGAGIPACPITVYVNGGLTAGPTVQGIVDNGATTITLTQYDGSAVTAIAMDTEAVLRFSGFYEV